MRTQLEEATADVLRAAVALVQARASQSLPRAREQELQRAVEAAARRYWAAL
jgi:hypothetical protein